MAENSRRRADESVLRSKRNATRYQILAQIAERQPAVSQQEIADEIGVTPQAVSDYLGGLVEEGLVRKHGRGRYETTKEGVDWLITQTNDLREYVEHVSEDVVGQVEIETALANAAIDEGDPVSLSMREGRLRATPGDAGSSTAVAVTSADAGEDVGVTDVEGMLEYELGDVTIVSVPRIEDGGGAAADPATIRECAEGTDLVAAAGVEAVAAAEAADVGVDVEFGTVEAVREAASKGLDVLLLVVADELPAHTDALRERTINYEVTDTDSDGVI